jgi:hypothetical protein
MRGAVGTNMVTSLNMAQAPHLLEDHELRQSYNGWTDEDGAWRSAQGPKRLYSGYSSISCLASGRMNGADHVVWLDGDSLYDNGVLKGTITAGDTMDIIALDDKFLIFGSDKNYIWDGSFIREQGTWQFTDTPLISGASFPTVTTGLTASTKSITGITEASPAVVTTSTAHGYVVGEWVGITSISGNMSELNGQKYKVLAVTTSAPHTITIDVNTSAMGAYGGSGVTTTAFLHTSGDYKWYLVPAITLANGRVLEGRPRGLRSTEGNTTNRDAYGAEVISVSSGLTTRIEGGQIYWEVDSTVLYTHSGTRGTDYTPSMRLYRTKLNGYDWYLEYEWSHGDTAPSFTYYDGGTYAFYSTSDWVSGPPDVELGGVYVVGENDHNNAPVSSFGDTSSTRRCLVNDTDNPNRVYWTGLDGIEFFNQNTDWDERPDTVTAIIGYRDGFVVWSSDRMWYLRFLDNLPAWTEIDTPVGTQWPRAIRVTEAGVVFLRPDGLYLFDGSSVKKVSRRAFPSILSPESVAVAGDLLYVAGSEQAFVSVRSDSGWNWHECDGTYAYADGTNGSIYASNGLHVDKLFAGARAGGRLKSKQFKTNFGQSRSVRLELDIVGSTVPAVWVNGNRQSDSDWHDDTSRVTETGRRIERISIPRLNNQYVEIELETTGDVTVYGYTLEEAK